MHSAPRARTSPGMLEAPLLRDEVGAIAVLTLNRPEARNTLSEAMLQALGRELAAIAADRRVRAVVLTAKGPAFSGGHDLKELTARRSDPDRGRTYFRHIMQICSAMMQQIVRLPQPVVAAVQGTATAAGCQLVASCDLAVASADARFGVSGINAGLFCSTPGVALSRNLGRKAAFEMLVTGEFIDADEARARGLVNRVAEPDELDAVLEQLVAAIVAKPRAALALGKALFYRQIEAGIAAAYADAGRTMACNMMDPSALDGVQAFIEKRKPGH